VLLVLAANNVDLTAVHVCVTLANNVSQCDNREERCVFYAFQPSETLMRKTYKIGALLLLLLSPTTSACGEPAPPDEAQTRPIPQRDYVVAFCLGMSEASISFYAEVMQISKKIPAYNADFARREAVSSMNSMGRALSYLSKQGYLNGSRDAARIVEARQEGLLTFQTCQIDQRVYAACIEQCSKVSTKEEREMCEKECVFPRSCREGPSCVDLDKIISD
jgi:hypothetical protein